MDTLLILVLTFIFFMAIWAIGMVIGRSIQKKRLGAFKEYIQNELPEINLETEEILIAKQKSKQVRPDILLMLIKVKREIILLTEQKDMGITHNRYSYDDLSSVESNHQIISRGMLPKTYSYEERLILAFNDGTIFQLVLENISNKQGDDQGANIVRNMFAPFKKLLNDITDKP